MSAPPVIIIISHPKTLKDSLVNERIQLLAIEGETTAELLRRAAEQVEAEIRQPSRL